MRRAAVALLLAGGAAVAAPPPADWHAVGRDLGATRYSPLAQITPANVSTLRQAWVYHLRPAGSGEGTRVANSQATPLVVAGTMFIPSPYGQVVALDAATGRERWVFPMPQGERPAPRGVSYWPGGRGQAARIIVPTSTGKLIALSAADGKPVPGFGEGGTLDARTPDMLNGDPKVVYGFSSPPMVTQDVIVTGGRTQERPERGASGDIRGWDVRTGKLLWTFHPIPRDGEFGRDTWEGNSGAGRSGVNVWNEFSVDERRGILYAPIAAPTFDRYGGDRKGANLFSSTLVALDLKTGKRRWHFQTVHHDIWDHDLPTAPLLFDVRKDGRIIPGVAAINKSAILFLLDRVTGEPIYPVTETPVPQSDVAGEQSWPTQPIPAKPPTLARESFSAATDLVDGPPEHLAFCERWIAEKGIRDSVRFTPLTTSTLTARYPGSGGGANWGGGAWDPARNLYIINTSDMGSVEQLMQRPDGGWSTTGGPNDWFADREKRWMCQKPPWGSLYAVNVATGEIAWRTTLGVTDDLPEGMRDTGRPSVGGPMATAGGVVFIAATDDSRLRAFETATGREVWTERLPASGHATPVSYAVAGKQYVAITATGGSFVGDRPTSDTLVAYTLP